MYCWFGMRIRFFFSSYNSRLCFSLPPTRKTLNESGMGQVAALCWIWLWACHSLSLLFPYWTTRVDFFLFMNIFISMYISALFHSKTTSAVIWFLKTTTKSAKMLILAILIRGKQVQWIFVCWVIKPLRRRRNFVNLLHMVCVNLRVLLHM